MTIFVPLKLNRSRILRSSLMVDIYFFYIHLQLLSAEMKNWACLICMLDTILVSGEYSRILHEMDSGGYVHIILAADWYAHRILLKGKVIYICICNFSWNSNVNFRKNKEEQNRGTVD